MTESNPPRMLGEVLEQGIPISSDWSIWVQPDDEGEYSPESPAYAVLHPTPVTKTFGVFLVNGVELLKRFSTEQIEVIEYEFQMWRGEFAALAAVNEAEDDILNEVMWQLIDGVNAPQ